MSATRDTELTGMSKHGCHYEALEGVDELSFMLNPITQRQVGHTGMFRGKRSAIVYGKLKIITKAFRALHPHRRMIKPTVPAMAITFLLFIIPKNPRSPSTSPPLLTWEEANEKAQWGIAILIGGGMCLAEASKVSCSKERENYVKNNQIKCW